MIQIMTGKRKLSWFWITLSLFIVISLWNITGCSENHKAEKYSDYAGFNSKNQIFYESTDLTRLTRKKIIYFNKPVVHGNYKIFVNDFLGNSKPEIVFTSGQQLLIYTLDGQLLLEKFFDRNYKPSFISDIDNDGKSDLIMGTESQPKNTIVVINGAGNIISKFEEDNSSQDFSSITPVGIYKKKLFAIARPEGAESSKGILCFNSFSMNLLYTFYTPDPVNISLVGVGTANQVMVPSYETHNDGVFRKYAQEKNTRTTEDYEKDGVYLKIGLNGTPLGEKIIIVRDKKGLGTMDFSAIPEVENKILLVHHTTKTNNIESFFQIFDIDIETGNILSSSLKQRGEYLDKRIIPLKSGIIILTSSKINNTFYINSFSENLELIKTISATRRPAFKQVVINTNKDNYNLYAVLGGSIYNINKNLELNKIITGTDYIDLQLFTNKNQSGLILLRKTGFEIFFLSP